MKNTFRISLWNVGCDTPVSVFTGVREYQKTITDLVMVRSNGQETRTSLAYTIETE